MNRDSLPRAFTYQGHPARVLFGAGIRSRAAAEIDRLGVRRTLLVASRRLGEEGRTRLGSTVVAVVEDVVMHVPADGAARALALAAEAGADGIAALGGGSAIGLAKAVARDTGLPILAIPTTYAGSEMTSIWGMTDARVKRTGRDPRVRPRTVLYDPELLVALPQAAAAASGLNATAHAMEALYAPEVDPVTQLLAEESIARLARHLPRPGSRPTIEDASESLYGAWLAGMCLDGTKMGLHHKLCHVLGGTFGLPHAETHAVVLPYVAAYNADAALEAMARIARALVSDVGPDGLVALARSLGAPASLAALGMKESDLEEAATLVLDGPYDNPRPVDRAGLRTLLAAAFAGAS